MKSEMLQLNLMIAWLWITLGFVSGMILGLNFHKEQWLGGYGSYPRRMYRLGHISFFGLAIINFLFCITVQEWLAAGPAVRVASRLFVVGAATMPLCCALMAQTAKLRMLFAVPVISLIAGALIVLWEILHL